MDLAHLDDGSHALFGNGLVEVGDAVDADDGTPLFVFDEDFLQVMLFVEL